MMIWVEMGHPSAVKVQDVLLFKSLPFYFKNSFVKRVGYNSRLSASHSL